jgi:putative membrane protein
MMVTLDTAPWGERDMVLRWLVATLHLLALPLGLGAIWMRARALARLSASQTPARIFVADNLWALAAVLWIATGLWRAFGGLEKGAFYYLHDPAFHAKMGLLILILLLEIWPMTTLIRWRIAVRRGSAVDIRAAPSLARVSYLQAGLVILMVFAATAVARGYFD